MWLAGMNTVITILIAILVFSVLIFVHELGHYLAARAAGIKINEFAIGMGPVLFAKEHKGIRYALRLLPIGGFLSMEGEDEGSGDSAAFCNKGVGWRVLVTVAGALMNVLLGFVLLIILISSQDLIGTRIVAGFNEGATSQASGLMAEDEILSINGAGVFIDNDIVYQLLRDPDGVVDMVVRRNGEKVELKNVTFQTVEVTGTTATVVDFKVYGTPKTPWGVLKNAAGQTVSVVRLVWSSLIDLLTGRFGLNQMSGPVGVTTAIGESAKSGIPSLLTMVIYITINLGVFNLRPIPALDGGRLLFLLIEAVRRKPINPKYEGYVHAAGFALLMLLVVVVTFNDITRLLGWHA